MEESEIIQKFSTSFIGRKARERAIFELSSNKKRMDFISKIGAMPIFFISEKFEQVKKSDLSSFDKISNEAKCYIISGFGDYDRLIMTFADAVKHRDFGGSGTIVYNYDRNRLIYHEELSFGAPKVYYASDEKNKA